MDRLCVLIASAHATVDSVVSHGRQLSKFGIKRMEEMCSTRLMRWTIFTGPIESCVNTNKLRIFINAAIRMALRL